jgi:hypothetical protein
MAFLSGNAHGSVLVPVGEAGGKVVRVAFRRVSMVLEVVSVAAMMKHICWIRTKRTEIFISIVVVVNMFDQPLSPTKLLR